MSKLSSRIIILNLRKLRHYYFNLLLNGQKNYTKYIVLGRSRTGSNYLRGLLNSHSQIIAFGEIFMNYDAGWGLPCYPQSKKWLSLLQNDPVQFLEKEIFIKSPQYIQAVGFKIFYYHAQNEAWKPVWTYLQNQQELRVIHLKRRNILNTHLSLEVAERTRQWIDSHNKGDSNTQIYLSYEECEKAFRTTREQEKQYESLFENHSRLDLYYEDLAGNHSNEMNRVQRFLNVDHQILEPLTYKQSRRPLSKTITNYFELKEQFKGSPWQEYFED